MNARSVKCTILIILGICVALALFVGGYIIMMSAHSGGAVLGGLAMILVGFDILLCFLAVFTDEWDFGD